MSINFLAWGMLCIPLAGAIIIGTAGNYLKRTVIECFALLQSSLTFTTAVILAKKLLSDNTPYQLGKAIWFEVHPILIVKLGLQLDLLTIVLTLVVTSIALLVNIYSLSYMEKDPDYARYFSYLSLFTFTMLTLVSADNSLQLFFGWEGVGFVSYLLIGFWFKRPAASRAALKAFLMNRTGDIGLLLGLILLLIHTGSTDYTAIFDTLPQLHTQTIEIFGYSFLLLNVICVLLFIGAISKSAQIPLQLWLPDSMVGPTPASALMHAATMVTAGVYLVARLAPLFEQAPGAKHFILFIGSTTALLLGIVALVQTDIKRVIAFSTISQLGYMMAGLGVSAYSASIFHLVTHAYFKALLFLSAGSVIIALQHEQSMLRMGGLWKRLPLTYFSFLCGSFALMGLPPFSGFYSKDLIIESVYAASQQNGWLSTYAFYALLIGIFTTAVYTSRLILTVFHGSSTLSNDTLNALRESHTYINFTLGFLSIVGSSVGFVLFQFLKPAQATSHHHGLSMLCTFISIIGCFTVYIANYIWPLILTKGPNLGKKLHTILASQYGLEKLQQRAVITVIQRVAKQFATIDTFFIDRLFVQGSTQLVKLLAKRFESAQSGWLYDYLLVMIMGLILFLVCIIVRA